VALVEVEAVADEVLVRYDEAHVANGEVVDEAPIGAVEQSRNRERGRPPHRQELPEVVERQAGVDDVLDDHHVTALDGAVQVLQEANPLVAAWRGASVAGELDEIDFVRRTDRAREVGEEEERAFQRRDEDGIETRVVRRDLRAQLRDAPLDLLGGEVRLADAEVVSQ